MITERKRRTRKNIAAAKMLPEFKRLVEEIIVKAGATPNIVESSYDWIMPTKGGTLAISIQANLSEGPGSVMCRFDNPDHAAKHHIFSPEASFNPHSGKWNHHFFGDWKAVDAAAAFQYALAKITLES